jgi:UDP-glucose 6-dehydrogenase
MLCERGIRVVAHDPAAMQNAKRVLEGADVVFADSPEQAVAAGDVVVFATAWTEFASIDPAAFRTDGHRVVIDCWRFLPREQLEDVEVIALGQSMNAHLSEALPG